MEPRAGVGQRLIVGKVSPLLHQKGLTVAPISEVLLKLIDCVCIRADGIMIVFTGDRPSLTESAVEA